MTEPLVADTKPHQSRPFFKMGRDVWNNLTTPHSSFIDSDIRRRARLISGLGLVLTIALILGAIAATYRTTTIPIQLFAALFMLGIYGLSRTQHAIAAGILMLFIMILPSLTYFIEVRSIHEVVPVYAAAIWVALPIVIGGLILPPRGAIVLNAFILVSLLFTKVSFVPNLDTAQFWNAFSFLTILSFAMVVTLRVREVYLIRPQIDQLLRASRVKDEFLATMSHELRTPLNAIIGYSSILLNGLGGELDDEACDLVGNIEESSKQLLLLITDILDISKIEAGEVYLDLEEAALEDLHHQWQRTFAPLAAAKGLEFDIQLAANAPRHIQTDPGRLTQIVTNLLSNAIKFTDKGRVSMKIQRKADNLVIIVEDSGIGIPKDQIASIFDKFKQVDATSHRQYEGTGLGLAITQRLVTLFGGQIEVSSKVNQGTTFAVTLPIAKRVVSEVTDLKGGSSDVKRAS